MLPQISVELLDNPSEMYNLGYTYQDIINFRRNFNLSKVTDLFTLLILKIFMKENPPDTIIQNQALLRLNTY